jgi:hypothetical protein
MYERMEWDSFLNQLNAYLSLEILKVSDDCVTFGITRFLDFVYRPVF